VAFSFAQGIFHPYYVSLLAPFTAALVGAGVALVIQGERWMRILGPVAVLAGAATEIAVLESSSTMPWMKPVLVLVAVTAAAVLANPGGSRWRSGTIATALAVLMLAPASWAVQTLGHATDPTFPAGGPASAAAGRGGPGGGGPGRMRGPRGQMPPGALGGMQAPPPGAAPGGRFGGRFGARAGGGGFGENSAAVTAAVAYANSHGGGAVAVSSQKGASGSIINSGANVVAIGGFSGRESQVSLDWFAAQVKAGSIRWVVADSTGGGMPNDGRVGAKDVISAVAQTCKKVETASGAAIYDCQGYADALAKLV
jgi:hypothetical protein